MKTLQHLVPKGSLILSPMAGYSDQPYRALTRKLGSALSITEFVSADMLSNKKSKTLPLLTYTKEERPIIFQVFGNNPARILQGVRNILHLKPDGIDLNLGCSVRAVAHAGSGAGLLKKPNVIKEIVQTLVKNIPLPISAKIRLGWDETSYNYHEVTDILESEGVWAIAVHGRTRSMRYQGEANWEKIGEIKLARKIPIFGNGDVISYEQGQSYIKKYGVDAVFVGRGAIGNPWIFAKSHRSKLNYSERLPLILMHLKAMETFYGSGQGAILFRKHLTGYLSDIPQWPALKIPLYQAEQTKEISHILQSSLADLPTSAALPKVMPNNDMAQKEQQAHKTRVETLY